MPDTISRFLPGITTGRMLHPESLPGTGRYHPSDEG